MVEYTGNNNNSICEFAKVRSELKKEPDSLRMKLDVFFSVVVLFGSDKL